jgi:hypothetical protein
LKTALQRPREGYLPKVFVTKQWGVNFERNPLLVFSTFGYRQSFIDKADEDDFVCIVATKGKPSVKENAGRLLGIAQCDYRLVDSESLLLKLRNNEPFPSRDYKNGKYKWPFGVSLRQAWYFSDKPVFKTLFGRNPKMSSVRGCELLSSSEARTILGLPRFEVPLPSINFGSSGLPTDDSNKAFGRRGSNGVPPTTGGFFITRERMTAFLYVLKFQDTDIFKVGWAFNVDARANDINKHIPSEIFGDQNWKPILWRKFTDQFAAFSAEQRLLNGPLKGRRTEGERVKLGEQELRAIWTKFHA